MVAIKFSKMTHFIECNKINDAKHVANLLSMDIVILNGILRSIVVDKNRKF